MLQYANEAQSSSDFWSSMEQDAEERMRTGDCWLVRPSSSSCGVVSLIRRRAGAGLGGRGLRSVSPGQRRRNQTLHRPGHELQERQDLPGEHPAGHLSAGGGEHGDTGETPPPPHPKLRPDPANLDTNALPQNSFYKLMMGDNKSEKFFKVLHERMKEAQTDIKATVSVNVGEMTHKASEKDLEPGETGHTMYLFSSTSAFILSPSTFTLYCSCMRSSRRFYLYCIVFTSSALPLKVA